MKKSFAKLAQPLTPQQLLTIKGGDGGTTPPPPPPPIVIEDFIQN